MVFNRKNSRVPAEDRFHLHGWLVAEEHARYYILTFDFSPEDVEEREALEQAARRRYLSIKEGKPIMNFRWLSAQEIQRYSDEDKRATAEARKVLLGIYHANNTRED